MSVSTVAVLTGGAVLRGPSLLPHHLFKSSKQKPGERATWFVKYACVGPLQWNNDCSIYSCVCQGLCGHFMPARSECERCLFMRGRQGKKKRKKKDSNKRWWQAMILYLCVVWACVHVRSDFGPLEEEEEETAEFQEETWKSRKCFILKSYWKLLKSSRTTLVGQVLVAFIFHLISDLRYKFKTPWGNW